MLAYIIRRIWQMIPTMLGVVLLIFFLFNWVGGDPAYILAGKMSNPEQIENIRQQLGIGEAEDHYDDSLPHNEDEVFDRETGEVY